MTRSLQHAAVAAALLLAPLLAVAQRPAEPPAAEVEGAQLESWLKAGRKLALVDTRSDQEYAAGHVPGALGIPAERTKEEGWRLPSDKTIPIVYYCRGPG